MVANIFLKHAPIKLEFLELEKATAPKLINAKKSKGRADKSLRYCGYKLWNFCNLHSKNAQKHAKAAFVPFD